MIELIGDLLIVHCPGHRTVTIQRVTAQDGVSALQAMGLSRDCASVFAYSDGRRDKIVALAVRKHLIVEVR